jgi:hypothetical protein
MPREISMSEMVTGSEMYRLVIAWGDSNEESMAMNEVISELRSLELLEKSLRETEDRLRAAVIAWRDIRMQKERKDQEVP